MSDLKQLTNTQLKQYLSKFRNDDEKFSQALEELLTRDPNPTIYPADLPLEQIEQIIKEKIENISIKNKSDRSFQVGDVGGDFKPVGAPILSDNVEISGTVAETINQLPSSSETDKPGIKELLNQLKEAIEDPNLPEDDKKQALEQLQVLAEAGQNLKDETLQKKAKKAIGFLQVIASGLEPAAKLTQACQSVIPAIAAWFGF
ncbi:hypothetical protein PCC7424_4101 [Gloeothece citriformis PCC 7424]|uniref:Pentapeptide repeat protein n=1 Tax=Gloeothece citriformis (strain PCC 7424) TaxID=65393 RepID=B7KLA2_GLOC7|nr:hypothetical protein [Gloeothece citriformis]ACK72474.1 hypothetical protein PCC7424_4101 [Gloeothece citriformis PCC 7424]